MGFYVTASIEHDSNSYDEFYVRIENYAVRKHNGNVAINIAHYKSKEGAAKAMPPHVEDIHQNNGEDLLHLNYPFYYEFPLTEEETVTVTTYSSSFSTQDIEYTDFDDDGNEVIKTRQQSIETIHTGSTDVVKNRVNLDLMTGSIYTYAYEKIIDEYAKVYGSENISNA